MSLQLNNEHGTIDVSNEVIATIAGGAAVECFGIIGMASKHQVRDGFTELLGKENYAKGVVVSLKEDMLNVDIYIIVSFGIKISEVARNVQSAVQYNLEKTLNLKVNAVNVNVQGVRVVTDNEK